MKPRRTFSSELTLFIYKPNKAKSTQAKPSDAKPSYACTCVRCVIVCFVERLLHSCFGQELRRFLFDSVCPSPSVDHVSDDEKFCTSSRKAPEQCCTVCHTGGVYGFTGSTNCSWPKAQSFFLLDDSERSLWRLGSGDFQSHSPRTRIHMEPREAHFL